MDVSHPQEHLFEQVLRDGLAEGTPWAVEKIEELTVLYEFCGDEGALLLNSRVHPLDIHARANNSDNVWMVKGSEDFNLIFQILN